MVGFYRLLQLRVNPFLVQLLYFISLSSLGYLVLIGLKTRTDDSFRPRNLDFFFTSVSAVTVSSMSTVEMEVFSDAQFVVLIILMFVGGEVFTSMVGLFLKQFKMRQTFDKVSSLPVTNNSFIDPIDHQVQMGSDPAIEPPHDQSNSNNMNSEIPKFSDPIYPLDHGKYLMYHSIRYLALVVLCYILVIHVLGVTFVLGYLALISSAEDVLKDKGLKMANFSIFTIVSTFANCGFVPTNENMMVFSKNSGLLLIIIPQILMGNTLFPSCLRFFIWVFGKFGIKKEESKFLLKNSGGIGYLHLLPSLHSSLLVVTVIGFILIQFIVFCSMEWSSEALNGLSTYQKLIGSLFETVNTRHTGATIVDLSIISPAILVMFIVFMYLPPYTSFLPLKVDEKNEDASDIRRRKGKQRRKVLENVILSHLSYLVIFIIIVCITERKRLKEDPLNFSALNIAFEVVSAYGNVGFTTGYGCKRQLNPTSDCKDKWFGFSGKWSDEGKIILIVVMLFGRLKKFSTNGGRAWILL